MQITHRAQLIIQRVLQLVLNVSVLENIRATTIIELTVTLSSMMLREGKILNIDATQQ